MVPTQEPGNEYLLITAHTGPYQILQILNIKFNHSWSKSKWDGKNSNSNTKPFKNPNIATQRRLADAGGILEGRPDDALQVSPQIIEPFLAVQDSSIDDLVTD